MLNSAAAEFIASLMQGKAGRQLQAMQGGKAGLAGRGRKASRGLAMPSTPHVALLLPCFAFASSKSSVAMETKLILLPIARVTYCLCAPAGLHDVACFPLFPSLHGFSSLSGFPSLPPTSYRPTS